MAVAACEDADSRTQPAASCDHSAVKTKITVRAILSAIYSWVFLRLPDPSGGFIFVTAVGRLKAVITISISDFGSERTIAGE